MGYGNVSKKRLTARSLKVLADQEKERQQRIYFRQLCLKHRLPVPTPEHTFASPRKWRFDYAWPEYRVALEVEGGIWTGGRHNRGAGFLKDMEKYNTAQLMGWKVLRTVPGQLLTLDTIDLLKRALARPIAA